MFPNPMPPNTSFPNKRPPRFMKLFSKEGELFTQMDKKVKKLIPVTAQHFRRLNEPQATIVIANEMGHVYFQSDEGNFVQVMH
jgi:hypothetical protein